MKIQVLHTVRCNFFWCGSRGNLKLISRRSRDEGTYGRLFSTCPVTEPCLSAADMFYHRWSQDDFTRGSYSDVVVGHTEADFKRLGQNLGRLFFAGEAVSPEWFGYMQGALKTGQEKGKIIAQALLGQSTQRPTWCDED